MESDNSLDTYLDPFKYQNRYSSLGEDGDEMGNSGQDFAIPKPEDREDLEVPVVKPGPAQSGGTYEGALRTDLQMEHPNSIHHASVYQGAVTQPESSLIHQAAVFDDVTSSQQVLDHGPGKNVYGMQQETSFQSGSVHWPTFNDQDLRVVETGSAQSGGTHEGALRKDLHTEHPNSSHQAGVYPGEVTQPESSFNEAYFYADLTRSQLVLDHGPGKNVYGKQQQTSLQFGSVHGPNFNDQELRVVETGPAQLGRTYEEALRKDLRMENPNSIHQAGVYYGSVTHPESSFHEAAFYADLTRSQQVLDHGPGKNVYEMQQGNSSQSGLVHGPTFKDHSNASLKLCLLAPKSIAQCSASIKFQGHGAQDPGPVNLYLKQFHLANFESPFHCWLSTSPIKIQGDERALITYHFTMPDSILTFSHLVSSFMNGTKQDSERDISKTTPLRKRRMLQFDMVDERGELLRENALNTSQWLAMLSHMVCLVNPLSITDCFREYTIHKPTGLERRFLNAPSAHLESIQKWACKLADALGGSAVSNVALNDGIGAQMCILSLGLFELLQSLVMIEDCRKDQKLSEVYVVILSFLHKYTSAGTDNIDLPGYVSRVFEEGISDIVRHISPFSYEWLSRLEVLGRVDSTWSFIEKARAVEFDFNEVYIRRNIEQAYRIAITELIKSHSLMGKWLRGVISRCALLVAPSLPSFLLASHELDIWARGAKDWDATENMEEEIRSALRESLDEWFAKLLPQNNSFKRRPASVVQQHLEVIVAEVYYTESSPLFLPDFLKGTYRQQVVGMLLEVISNQGWDSESSRSGNRKSENLSFIETARRVILDCPHTFRIPLLPVETRLVLKLAAAENDEIHNLGKSAILKLGKQFSVANNDPKDVEHLSKSVLRPWILASVKRGKYQQSLSPLAFFAAAQELLELSNHPLGGMEECLISAAVASSQQQSRGLHLFLAEAGRTSQLHPSLQDHYRSAVVGMIQKQLQSVGTFAEVDRIGEQVLQALCSQSSDGALMAKEKMQVEFSIALLDGMAMKDVFVEHLEAQAIETISSSNFASILMRLEVLPGPIENHWIFKKVWESCSSFGTSLVAGDVTLGRIDTLVHHGQWNAIFVSIGNKKAADALESAIKELSLYKKRLELCDILVNLCGFLTERGFPIQGLQDWSKALTERKESWRSTPLKNINRAHWPEEVHPCVYENLETLLLLHKSVIFKDILSQLCRELFDDQRERGEFLSPLIDIEGSCSTATPQATFDMVVAELLPRSVQNYRDELAPYFGKKNLEKVLMERLYSLWVAVDAHQIEREFDLARRELKVVDSKSAFLGLFRGKGLDMVELIQAWKAIKAKAELLDALPKVAELFDFDGSCGGYIDRMENLRRQCQEDCTLKDFSELHKSKGKAILAMVSEEEEFAVIQLAKSDLLIDFLKEKLDEDFRNLIDAVEEQSDNDFVQESILSDLIDLHRLFRPVLKSSRPTFEQLRASMYFELRTSKDASLLAAKLVTCNENVAQIRQFLSSVANRGLKMKDHMKRILKGGRYQFTASASGCNLKLTCGGTGFLSAATIFDAEVTAKEETGVYLLAELQDIRSRARLVLSTHKAQAKRYLKHESDTPDAETEESTMQFIEQVDIVEQLVSSISEVCASGHFQYANFDQTVSGLQELKDLSQKVGKELGDWYAAVKQARSTHSCLNYFRSIELRLFLEVLSRSNELWTKEVTCEEILQWAGIRDADIALRKAILNFMCLESPSETDENYLSACLNAIAMSIEHLFGRSRSSGSGLVNSPKSGPSFRGGRGAGKHNGALVLTLVENPDREHDAVVNLFHERSLSLRDTPRNVLLCTSTTAWEEIDLLLRRCFVDEMGQKGGFFCIAYIENLSFECQAQFVITLQDLVQRWENHCPQELQGDEDREQLALVCCSKNQAMFSVLRHLNVRVCHMEALSANEILNQLPAECKNIRVITSDIPGLGKSRMIRNMAPNLVRPLSVSGSTSRDSLVLQLKELKLQPGNILHLDISTVVNPETFNMLLFELVVLGCLKSNVAGVFHLNISSIYIELGNTLGNELAHSLPVSEWFQREHLTWDLGSLEVSDNPNSSLQVVCLYLEAMELGQLETKNLIFRGDSINVQAISTEQCHGLLKRHFIDHMKQGNFMSFSIIDMFLNFLACQLRKLTENIYFTVETLQYMMAMPNIRTYLVTSLLEVARDLSLRSVKPWLHEQQQSRGRVTDLTMAARFEGMMRWSDSNHVMIFFQSDGPISLLYRNANLLPASIVQLFTSQRLRTEAKNMSNYSIMSSQELWTNLCPILQRLAPTFQPDYVLTADNFLKMALIALRVEATVPVIIMGETGCGKTSLLKVLASYCGVEFRSTTLHAGTTEKDIRCFIKISNEIAATESKKVWAFLDEINACDHLGFLNGLICHHLLDGKALDMDLVILAACNPYRLHDIENARTGFSARELMNPGDSEHFNLAYRVHPLPEAMLDYVWDFGLLSRHDEQAYIEAMVQRIKVKTSGGALFTDLLVQSQAFIRQCHGEASVSLRDVSRCISLYEWFLQDLQKRPSAKGYNTMKVPVRATLLAFSHCYHSRLATEQERERYRDIFAGVIKTHEPSNYRNFDGNVYAELLKEEQMDLLNRMDVPPGIAKNKALLENIFVSLVCMLNLIPVFVVGKPGSGKTLALQLIYGNLRGSESRDLYFQQLPQMYRFSYQGSESSTSEGILKVFEKAYRCRRDNEGRDVLVVVVLDEVGLAEVSNHNPLKVLHALLEPEKPQEVSVVGISNWSLDAAKMNRAIHLAQPDPSEHDLYETSIAILESYGSTSDGLHLTLKSELKKLSRAYYNYHSCQSQPNFHGLRDFYSLVKSLQVIKSTVSWQLQGLVTAIWRNFGGSPDDVETFSQILKENLGHEGLLQRPPAVMELVRGNLQDRDGRHLMLITAGESAIGIVEKFQENVVVIHGSKYKDDCSDDYQYLLLSIIILHMEAGRCILLRGVERLWSSLYDMLNQHYTVVGGRRNCRIAIGAYSNPMCYVHDTFRCIVVVDFDQIPRLDPPFLNRFEKQVLTYDNMLEEPQRRAVQILKTWCEQMAGVSTDSESSNHDLFKIGDMFAGFHKDTLPSLVLHKWSDSAQDTHSDSAWFTPFLESCKENLLRTAYMDGMVRASLSERCQQEVADLEKCTQFFFNEREAQQGLQEFLVKMKHEMNENLMGFKVVITTRSIIHLPIDSLLNNPQAQFEKLGDFSSERQLQSQIQLFLAGEMDLLVLQADAGMDREHIPHAKFLVDKNVADFQAQVHGACQMKKNILLIIHTHREVESLSGFTFLSGWKQLTLDQLVREETDVREFLNHSIADLVKSETIPFKDIMMKVLTWSFLCIKYPKGIKSAKHCQEMVQKISADRELWDCFKRRALVWLIENANPSWQASVASNRGLLSLSSSLQEAFLHHIEETLREPVARLIYFLEKFSALGSYFTMDAGKRTVWRATVLNAEIVDIEGIPAPRHPEGYQIKGPLSLSLPFSTIYSQQVENGFQELYMTQLLKISGSKTQISPSTGSSGSGSISSSDIDYKFKSVAGDFDRVKGEVEIALEMGHVELNRGPALVPPDKNIGKAITAAMRTQLCQFATTIHSNSEFYVKDFCKIHAPYKSDERNQLDAQAFEWVVRENLDIGSINPADVHILMWEQGEKINAQALLAASCLKETFIEEQLALLIFKKGKSSGFDQFLVAQCCQAILPQGEVETQSFPHDLDVRPWIESLELLIKLASPLEAFEGSTHWATIVSLEVLRDVATLVLPPVSWDRGILEDFSKWVTKQGMNFNPGQLLEVVLSILPPDLGSLTGVAEEHFFRFLATFFIKILSGDASMSDMNTIAEFIFRLDNISCLMKSVVLRLLDVSVNHTLPFSVDTGCPAYILSLLNGDRKGGLQVGEIPFDSEKHKAFVLLSDVVYEKISPFVTQRLLRGQDGSTGWMYKDFLRCLDRALDLTGEGVLTLQSATAIAFLRATLDAVAAELIDINKVVACARDQMSRDTFVAAMYRLPSTFVDRSSTDRFEALRLYLLKVLHMKWGLSLLEISNLATKCNEIRNLNDHHLILHWESMHKVTNPLGFDPFWSDSPLFAKASEAVHFMSIGQESKGKKVIDRADQTSQSEVAAAVASRIYLTRASRPPTSGECSASHWFHSKNNLKKWDEKWRRVVRCFAPLDAHPSGWEIGLSPSMPTSELWCKSLAAHILFVVTGLPQTSPLQGYMSLDGKHLDGAFVLAIPDSPLAAFRTIVGKGLKLGEYRCPCGYEYFVGECFKPMQSTNCPGCKKTIGGADHTPAVGNVLLSTTQQIQKGYIVDNMARSDTFYSIRELEHKCFRALRLLVHFCLLNALYLGRTAAWLVKALGLPAQSPPLMQELQRIIEEDFVKLDILLGCNREITVKYMHSVVSFLRNMQNNQVLVTREARTLWELEFQRIFDNGSFDSGAHKAAADYLERQKGNDRYSELIQERGYRHFPPAIEALLRITTLPSLRNFKAIYMQDSKRIATNPLIRVFFDHEKNLGYLNHLMPLLRFCDAIQKKFSFKISRPDAASKRMNEILKEERELEGLFKQFEISWNAVRENVERYECKELTVPVMNRNVPLAMCLVEPRDQGLYIVAIFEYLRNLQNSFLDAVISVGFNTHHRTRESSQPASIHIQNCKTGDVIHHSDQLLEKVVNEVAMADPRFGYGQQLLYDDCTIQKFLCNNLVVGKAHLGGDWIEFSYEHEAFHRHATILADVATAIPQEALRLETLQAIQREIEIGGVGAGQFLAMLNLCLGFLRRTGGYQHQPLGTYCELWLGKDAADLITKNSVFDQISLKHIVSLYEGLEDCASNCIGNLVSQRYRTPLTASLANELFGAVKTDNGWMEEADPEEKIPASTFQSVLRRFMFRYLSVDHLRSDVQLHLYLTDTRLVKWPKDAVEEDIVDNNFPPNLLLQHSFATYMLLTQICKGGDWKRAGLVNGWIAGN